ncbi:MAG: hypothetical protein JW704_05355 [Anaerolineaceae bacterium]|nr:hypothetical protein [Anaerolineaceae bacterium]
MANQPTQLSSIQIMHPRGRKMGRPLLLSDNIVGLSKCLKVEKWRLCG